MKTKEEFNLSEKIAEHQSIDLNWIDIEDVKEFIRRLKEEIKKIGHHDIPDQTIHLSELRRIINELAGDKLT